MACSSSCTTPGAHSSWGECVRAKALTLGTPIHQNIKEFRREQNAYASAVSQGIQPGTTRMRDIQASVIASERNGYATTIGG